MPKIDYKQIKNSPIVDAKNVGVTYGSGVSSTVRTANTTALQNALNNELNLYVSDIIEVNGTITITDKNIHLHGRGLYGVIRQTIDANLLVINQSGKSTETNIYDLCFEAGGTFITGAAITHNGYNVQDNPDTIYQKPYGNLRNLTIKGQNNYVGGVTAWTHEWRKGVVFTAPNRMTFKDSTIQGVSGTNNTTGTVGIEISTSRAAVETVFDNIQVINVQTGLRYNQATTYPAVEGLHILNCTFVANWRSIDLQGSTAYGAPGWYITGCHFASYEVCINVSNLVQGFIQNCLFYNFGNNTAGQTAAMVQLTTSSDWNISNNKMYYQGDNTQTNRPYGILIAGSSTVFAVANIVSHNYLALSTTDTKPAIWLQNFAVNNKIFNNYRNGGNATVISNLPYNTITNNTPFEAIDGGVQAILSGTGTDPGAQFTRISANDATQGYNLDASNLRSELVVIPSGIIESNSFIKTVTMNYGQTVTLYFSTTVTVQHSADLYLEDNVNQTFYAGEKLTLYKPYFSGVIEKTRSLNFNKYVFVNAANGLSQSIDPSRGKVFSIYNNTASNMTVTVDVTKMKFGQEITIKRYSDTSTGGIDITSNSGFIQKTDGGFVSTWALPGNEGARQFTWVWTSGGNLELVAASSTSSGAYTNEDAQDAAASLFTTGTHNGISFTYDDTNNKINATVTGQSGVPYTDENAQDAAASLFTTGTHSGITFTYDDANNKINASVSYNDESAQDAAASLFTTGNHSGISFTYDDAGNKINATVTTPTYTDENAQDAAASLFTTGTHNGITFTYDDATNKINASVTGQSGVPYTDENAQDAAASLFTTGTHSGITFTYDDANNKINANVSGTASDLVADTTALAAYTGSATVVGTKDGRWWTYNSTATDTPNNGNIVTATGKGGGRWLLTAPVTGLNVKWFGATGDGTTDDTTACQAALNAASSSTTLGNRVYFPEGTYLVYSLSVPEDISVDLTPNATIKGRTLTTTENNVQANDQTISGIVELSGGSSISGGGTIDGNKSVRQKGHGVKIYATSSSNKSSQVFGINIKNTKNGGIFCQSGFKPLFQNNKIDSCDDRGIDIVETNYGRIIGNTIDSCAHGIQWFAGGTNWIDSLTINGNVVTNVAGGGIWGYRGRYITVTGNAVNNCNDVGIDFEQCEDCTASGNTVKDCYNGGLTVFYASKRIDFIGNVVNQGTGKAPCVVFNGTGISSEIKIEGGSLYSNGFNPVNIFGGCIACVGDGTNQLLSNVIINNVNMECTQSAYSPIRLTDVTGGSITNCKNIKGNAATCISLEGCSNFDVSGNTLIYSGTTNASAKGIQLISRANFLNQYNTVKNNTIDAGYQMGVYDDPWSNILSYNKIIDNITPAVTFGAVVTPISGYNGIIERNRSSAGSLVDNSAMYTSFGIYFASTTYVYIGQVLGNSDASNAAQLAFKLYHTRGWDSSLQCVDEYVIANKAASSFSQNIIQKRTGNDGYTTRSATIVAYETTISTTTVNNIYIKIAAGYNQVGLSIDYLGSGMKLSSYTTSTTAPTGTLVYDSGDPITYPPTQLNNTVSTITSTGDTGNTTRYFPIAVLPASGGATYDHIELDIELGSWDAFNKQQIYLYAANKTTFTYRWTSMGNPQAGAFIVAYQNSGVTTIYACMDKSFRMCSYTVRNNVQCTVYDVLVPIAGTPSGSIVFNSSDTATYPYSPQLGVTAPIIRTITTSTYTLSSKDWGCYLEFTNSSGCTVTLPDNNSIVSPFNCSWAQIGAGQISFVGASGVSIRSYSSYTKSLGQYAAGSIISRTINEYLLTGAITA